MRMSRSYAINGDVERSLEVHDQAADLVQRMEGEESLAHATVQRSRARLLLQMGQFDAAEDSLREALALADRIAEHPNQARAFAYFGLGNLMFFTGRYEQALARTRKGIEECAASRGLTADEHPCGLQILGRMKARMHRWEGAEHYLQQARGQFVEKGPQFERRLALTESWLAFVACHQGRNEEGARLLAKVHARSDTVGLDEPIFQAQNLTARATCRYRTGDHEQALEAIDRALEIISNPQPGYAMLYAQRRILRARILGELGRNRQAAESLDQARRQLEAVGLTEHPVMERIHQTRQDLF